MASNPAPPLKIGVLLFDERTQLLDVAPIDLLGMLDGYYLRAVGMPEEVIARAPRFDYHFINETGEGPTPMTGGFRLAVTDSLQTCPPLDILLMGGPAPSYRPSPAMIDFLRRQHAHVSAFLTICTGYVAPLHAGLLQNLRATAPRDLLPLARKEFPDVQWEERRWVRDGKVWTAGAVMNGIEMMCEFLKDRFGDIKGPGGEGGEGLVDVMLGMADVPRRGGAEY